MTVPSRISRFSLLLAGLGLVVAAACGSSSSSPDSPVEAGAGEGGTPPGGDSGVDAGCPVKWDGPRAGTTAASVPRGGAGIAWASPEAARDADGQLARATLDVGQSSEHLRITDFGFTIPATATIKGVEVELARQAADTGIGDGAIELWLDGTPSDRPKFLATSWPRVIVGTHHYGQAVDTWGNALTPALVGQPGFGVEIYAVRQEDAGSGALEARIESMRITVFYCD